MTLTAAGNQVAQEFGVSPSTIWNWRAMVTGPSAVDAPTQALAPAPKPRPRMSQRTLLYRAWIATRLIDVFRLLGDAVAMFWINTVLQIGELGEDSALSFGNLGDTYRSRKEFAEAAGRTEAELDDLIHRGLLIGVPGGGLGLPARFGLRPREPIGGDLVMTGSVMPLPARPARGTPDPRQTSLPPMGMPAAAGDSRNIHSDDSRKNPAESAPNTVGDSRNIHSDDSRKNAVASAEEGTTTTTTKDESLLGGGGLVTADTGEAAGDSSEIPPNIPGVDSSEIPAAPPPHVALAAELVLFVRKVGHPTPVELEGIREWLEHGASPGLIWEAVRGVMGRRNAPEAPTLVYFSQRVRELMMARAVAPAASSPSPVPAPPQAPEKPEDTVDWLPLPDDLKATLTKVWASVRAALHAEAGDAEYRNWLRPMRLRGIDGDELVITLPTEFLRDWVRDRHGSRIAALWRQGLPDNGFGRVDFRVAV